jgi:hypothetical protein
MSHLRAGAAQVPRLVRLRSQNAVAEILGLPGASDWTVESLSQPTYRRRLKLAPRLRRELGVGTTRASPSYGLRSLHPRPGGVVTCPVMSGAAWRPAGDYDVIRPGPERRTNR